MNNIFVRFYEATHPRQYICCTDTRDIVKFYVAQALATVLFVSLAIMLASCGGETVDSDSSSDPTSVPTSEPTITPTVTPTATITPPTFPWSGKLFAPTEPFEEVSEGVWKDADGDYWRSCEVSMEEVTKRHGAGILIIHYCDSE